MFTAAVERVPTLLMFALSVVLAAVVNEERLLMIPSNCEFAVCIVTAGNGAPLPVTVFFKYINWPAFALSVVVLD